MKRFVKNVGYGLVHFYSLSGRDSRQTFCDIYKGLLILALLGVVMGFMYNTSVASFLRDAFALSDTAYWAVLAAYELFLLLALTAAAIRRWQDLDIRIPKEESVQELVSRPRFWQVLAKEEGTLQRNRHGEAPKDTPAPLISDKDLPTDSHQVENSLEYKDVEELK